MQLKEAVPWGRSAEEYQAMFTLTSGDLARRILDCGGGPSSFTAEMHKRQVCAASCDPLYAFSEEEIGARIDETYPRMLALNEANRENFLWDRFGSPLQLCEIRMKTMRTFLDDYPTGKAEGRYVTGSLPSLPWTSGSFDLALCSHFLFTYSEQFSLQFHIESLLELVRIAAEVRVFPILTAFSGELSPHLDGVISALDDQGCAVEIVAVQYEFQKGGNQMLRITRPQ